MQAAGQKALGRIHLQTSMFQTEQFYCMISFNWKHLVLSSWHSNHLYFIVYILRTKIGQPAGHLPWWMPWPCQGGRGVRDGERERERNISNGISQCDYWRNIWNDLYIIAFYRHQQCTNIPKDLTNFSKFILCMSFQQNITIPVTTKPELMKAWFCSVQAVTTTKSSECGIRTFDPCESSTRCLQCFLASQARIQF